MAIGEYMEAINEEAYMNGYNRAAFLSAYLAAKHPHLLAGMSTDEEAGIYVALYSKADNAKAAELLTLLLAGVANPEVWYRFLEEEGGDIEWD